MAAPTLDVASSTKFGTATTGGALSTPQTVSITLAAGASLVVSLHGARNVSDISSVVYTVTYGGVSMSSVVPAISPDVTARSQKFGLLNCGTGSAQTLSISMTGTNLPAVLEVGWTSWLGAGGFSGGASTSGTATNSPTLAITSSTNSAVDASASHGDIISGVGAGGTSQWTQSTDNASAGGFSIGGTWAGASSVSTSFTSGVNDVWSVLGVSIDAPTYGIRATTNVGGSTTITKPTAVVGDIIVIVWHSDNFTDTPSCTGFVTGPLSHYNSNRSHGVLTRICDGTEGTSFPVSGMTSVYSELACVTLMGGVNAIRSVTFSSTAVTAGASAVAGDLEVVLTDFDFASISSTAPAGFTRFLNGSNSFNFYGAYRVAASTGTTATADFTANGNSGAAGTIDIIATVTTTPSAPTLIMATGGDTRIYLDWSVPTSDGGAAISDYTVQTSANGTSGWSTVSASASTVDERLLTGQTNGTAQFFRVGAVNSVGTGAWSNVLSATPNGFGTALLESEGTVTRNDEAGGNRNLEATASSGSATAFPSVMAMAMTMPAPQARVSGTRTPSVANFGITMPAPTMAGGGVRNPAAFPMSMSIFGVGSIPATLGKGVGSISRTNTARDLGTVGASWYYDWADYSVANLGPVPSTPGIEYVPQIWGDWINDTRYDIGTGPSAGRGPASTLLGFNEPDVPAQANMTVARALALWPQLEATGARLGSPAVGGDLGNSPLTWLSNFMSGNGGTAPRVDFICAHWYPTFNSGYTNIADYLDYLHTTYGKPIWLTEVGSLNAGASANATLMDTVMTALSTRPWVERVAWFVLQPDGSNNELVSSAGTANSAGTTWASYPAGNPRTSGAVVSAGSTPTPAAFPMVLTMPAPTLGVGTTKATSAFPMVLTMPAPQVGVGAIRNPSVMTLALTMPSPTAQASSTPTPGSFPMVLTMPAPQAGAGAVRTPGAFSMTLTMPAPLAGSGSIISPSAMAMVLTMPSPSLLYGAGPTPGVFPMALTMPAPTPGAGATKATSAFPMTITMPAPLAGSGSIVNPSVMAMALTMPAPSLFYGATPTANPMSMVLTMPAPQARAGQTSFPSTFSMTVSMPTPTVTGQSGAVASPSAFAMVMTMPAPTKSGGATSSPAVMPITLVPLAVLPKAGMTAAPSPFSMTLSMPAPTVVGGSAGTANPIPLALTLTMPPAVASGSGSRSPATMPMGLTMPVPAISVSGTRAPSPLLMGLSMPQLAVSAGATSITQSIPMSITMPSALPHGGSVTLPGTVVMSMTFFKPSFPTIWRPGVLNDADSIYLGTLEVQAVYLGSTKIWPPEE